MKLGILTSHPIQYQAPLFRELSKEMDVQVYFSHRPSSKEQSDAGFGVEFDWDIDLLDGYNYVFLHNKAEKKSVNHFFGCDNPEISEFVRMEKFDAFLVMGWYMKSYWQAVFACKRYGVPVMVRGDSQLSTPRSTFKKLAKFFLYRWLLKKFDAYLIVGERAREYLLHYGVSREKMFDVPHYVDNDWFRGKAQLAENRKKEIRDSFGINDEAIILLFAGKFIPKKRPADIIRAQSLLVKKGINVVSLFVGNGELKEALIAEAEHLGVIAIFAGFKNQSELPEIYVASDILVLPSDGGETWGLVVNEAMACGLPAIVSDKVGCAPDLIVPKKTGDIYPVGNIEKLSHSIVDILPYSRSIEVKNNIDKVIRNYSIESAVDGIKAAVFELKRGVSH